MEYASGDGGDMVDFYYDLCNIVMLLWPFTQSIGISVSISGNATAAKWMGTTPFER